MTGEAEHRVQELHGAQWLGLVCQEHLEDAVAERVDVLVLLAVFRQVLGMLVYVLDESDEFFSCHFIPFYSGNAPVSQTGKCPVYSIRRFFGTKYA